VELSVKKVKYIWALFALSLLASPITQAADLKVGVVNAASVLDKSPQKAAALARLEKEFASRSQSLESKHKALRAAQEKLNKDGAILSADERRKRERDIVSEQRELQRLQDEYSEDLQIRRNEELRALEKKIAATIVELAEKEAYDLIIYQGVIYASDKVDLTDKVLAMLKTQ
jgi:outer membrane protein